MSAWRRVLAVGALLAGGAAAAQAQTVRTAVAPETVAVGDVFHAAIRVDAPDGTRVELPDTLPLSGDLENAGRRRVRTDTLADGALRVTARYPLSGWSPGPSELPPVSVRLTEPDAGSARTLEATFPSHRIRSVLPADTAGVEPREEKGVVGPAWPAWMLALAVLAVAAVGAGGVWLYGRGRGGAVEPLPSAPPHERALALLDRARRLDPATPGDLVSFYALIAEALRGYLAAVSPLWGVELTTSELVERLPAGLPDDERATAVRILAAADLVKFAGRRPAADEALSHWSAARRWVETRAERRAAAAEAAAEAEAERPESAAEEVEVA